MAESPKFPPYRDGASYGEGERFPQESYLVLPEVKDLNLPPEYTPFFERVLPHFLLAPELQALFESADILQEQVHKLREAFKLFPEDYEKFLKLVRVRREREEQTLSQDTTIRAYGLEQTLVFVLGVALYSSVTKKPFEWDSRGIRPKHEPTKLLQHSIKARHMYAGREVGLAFAAGLYFDVLVLIARFNRLPHSTLDCIANCVRRGLETARIGTALARKCRDLRLSNYLFSACILSQLGDATQAVMNPRYIKFLAHFSRDRFPRSVRGLCESQLFGVQAAVFGSLLCRYSLTFNPIADALLYRDRPYILKDADQKDQYHLATVCCLASNIQAFPNFSRGAVDPAIVRTWLHPETQDLGLGVKAVTAALEELV